MQEFLLPSPSSDFSISHDRTRCLFCWFSISFHSKSTFFPPFRLFRSPRIAVCMIDAVICTSNSLRIYRVFDRLSIFFYIGLNIVTVFFPLACLSLLVVMVLRPRPLLFPKYQPFITVRIFHVTRTYSTIVFRISIVASVVRALAHNISSLFITEVQTSIVFPLQWSINGHMSILL